MSVQGCAAGPGFADGPRDLKYTNSVPLLVSARCDCNYVGVVWYSMRIHRISNITRPTLRDRAENLPGHARSQRVGLGENL